MENIKQKINVAEKSVALMVTDFIRYMQLAEEKNDLSYVKTGNCLKRKSEVTKAEIKVLEHVYPSIFF